MAIDDLPEFISSHYEVHEWKHALAILRGDFHDEWIDLIEVLTSFRLTKGDILSPGGGKSNIAQMIDESFYSKGWREKAFDTSIVIDGIEHKSPTHKIDCFKNRIALETEWNNKDPFFDRDLNNFRLLFDVRAISVGVIITRCDSLQQIFDELGKGSSYGSSTTHMSKLIPRIEGGGGGGCPTLIIGIGRALYVSD